MKAGGVRTKDSNRIRLITALIILLIIMVNSAILSLFFMTPDPPSMTDNGTNFDDAPYGAPIKRSDSDVILIDDEYRPWPDRLSDAEEINEYGTDWRIPDTDGDGMEDGWEVHYRKWIPELMKWSLDPLIPDAFENPDGDGYDADHDGVISDEEALFNLREYCGGAVYDFDLGCFDLNDPIFGGLSPVDNATEIAMLGGFHLLYNPEYREIYNAYLYPNPTIYSTWPENHPQFPVVTSDPSENDTDNDGLDDGWEMHFAKVAMELLFYSNGSFVPQDPMILTDLELKIAGMDEIEGDYDLFKTIFTHGMPFCPFSKWDLDLDLDVYPFHHYGAQNRTIWIYRPDGLPSLEEYEYGTSPLLWDTDGDSFYNTMEERFYDLSDGVEVLPPEFPSLG